MTPLEHLVRTGNRYPSAWKMAEALIIDHKDEMGWPDWCLLPLSGWHSILQIHIASGVPDPMLMQGLPDLGALGAWRYSQGIYRFDPAMYDALINTPVKGKLPCDLLFTLPEWCVYCETPGAEFNNSPLSGFWCHLEHDFNTGEPELRFLLNLGEKTRAIIIHLGDWTLEEAIQRSLDVSVQNSNLMDFPGGIPDFAPLKEPLIKVLPGLLSLVLYLCSEAPDISDREHPGELPSRYTGKRVKKGFRMFPAKKPRTWTVGSDIGRKIRSERPPTSGSTQRSVKEHIRRPHWHGYWHGKKGNQIFRCKWMAPIFVQGNEKQIDGQ